MNNVETFCCVPRIFEKGADWFLKMGSKGSPGTKLLSISGDCANPGVYEVPFGIKLSDGMYDEGNQQYLKTFNPDQALRTNLPYIIHSGDFLACHAEYDQWKRSQ